MTRIHLGYAVRRTFMKIHDGKTICRYPQPLFPTREAAEEELPKMKRWDPSYEYDITDVWLKKGTR